jgi:hypothetical protein
MSAVLGITAVVLTTAGEIKAIILLASVFFAAAVAIGLVIMGQRNGDNPKNKSGDSGDEQ